jgi:hypothetical protein
MYGSGGSLLDGLGAGLFGGDSSCYAAVANAGLRCLRISLDLRAFRGDLAAAFGAGILVGSLLTILLHRTQSEASSAAAAANPPPVNVSVSQRVSTHGPARRYARRPEPATEVDHQSTSEGTSISGRHLRVRPLRGRAGSLA